MFACIHLPPPLPAGSPDSLLRCAGIFSPRVEETAPGTVILDLEGLDVLFGSFARIAERIGAEARSFGLNVRIAVASNPDAAVHLARGHAGITVVESGGERQKLSSLPADVLSPSPAMLATLDRWGIRTLGAFAKLSAEQIAARLGQEGVHLHKLARGAGARPLVARMDSLRFEESLELDDAVESLEPLTFILARALDRLCTRLRTRGMATHEVLLRLDLERHAVFTRVLRLPLPVHNSRLLLKLFMLDLQTHPPGGPIVGLKVEAQHTKPRVIQKGLFVPLSPEPEKLELTLARIVGIVGEGNVGSPQILDTHRPQAFRVNHFTAGPKGVNEDRPQLPPLACLPMRVFRPPLEATVHLRDGIPIWIAFPGFHGAVETASGPWRGSGDWWNEQRWDREEWDIEVLPSALYRIYRDLSSQRWFTEGVYD
jgi:protein ImuB